MLFADENFLITWFRLPEFEIVEKQVVTSLGLRITINKITELTDFL